MFRPAAISIICLLSVCFHTAASSETDAIDLQISLIQEEFQVEIHYQLDIATYFPAEWKDPSLKLAADGIEVSEVTRLIPLIRQFLEAHPSEVVRTDLEHIYLLRRLSFRNKAYGSTYREKSMYITCDGVENRYDDAFMLRRLHSEFSSILMVNHTFPTNSWSQLNPAGFRYSDNAFGMIDNPSRFDSTDRCCSEGFLVNYCRSSLENDFNIISAWLFTKKSELNNLAQQHNRLQQKQALAEQFYRSLSGQYSFN
jgi:hypothetical protein